jgi:flagellar L-ring protein precursor FlgH
MKQRFLQILAVGVVVSTSVHAQDMRSNVSRSLFADQKAAGVGDAVMIYVVETSSASNDARTNASRESGLSFAASGQFDQTALPSVGANIGSTNDFKGQGSTRSEGSMRARVSARVDSVLPNGNLFVQGSRKITINGEEQEIKISGIIRPSDIQSDNSVYSYNISDANIAIQGKGMVADAQEPGWLTKFFHWIF